MQEFKDSSGACPEYESQIVFYAAEELEGAERDALEEHLDECARCVAALDAERKLLEMAGAHERLEPTPRMLASCRNRLEDSLDEMDHRNIWTRWAESLFPAHWLALHPAASVATLLLVGFSVGMLAPWHSRGQNAPLHSPVSGSMASMFNPQELQSANVSGINWTPSAGNQPPQVQVQMKTERPIVVQGTVNDSDVKRVLLYVLHNNERFCPDVRMSAVELLRERANDPEVQKALSQAVLTDRNAAVRMKALDALSAAKPDDASVQTMLQALTKDANIGVRIEAINSLREISERGELGADPRAMNVLQQTMRTDPNMYIRLQSAAAVQEVQPNQ
ncbi:MAG TPA: HEAT repeat domain-containing protein [Candidatus Acidoferrales bacterium]|nr:HEAT repeat domain-containing protein [Candidatus Acidoferrales bacterium]